MRVQLDEATHTYTSSKGVRYISATQLIKLFTRPFDPETASVEYAKKNGKTPAYWKALWAKARDDGSERGNKLHKAKDALYNGRGAIRFRESIRYVKNQAFFRDLESLEDGVYSELMLWNDPYHAAGQADVVNIRTEKDGRYADIDDHKTNKTIHMAGYNKATMLFPLNNLQDCTFQHHELQVSLYMYMLEMEGYKPGVLQFTHYGHPDSLGLNPEPKVYPLTYRRAEVKAMLNHYRKHGAA